MARTTYKAIAAQMREMGIVPAQVTVGDVEFAYAEVTGRENADHYRGNAAREAMFDRWAEKYFEEA